MKIVHVIQDLHQMKTEIVTILIPLLKEFVSQDNIIVILVINASSVLKIVLIVLNYFVFNALVQEGLFLNHVIVLQDGQKMVMEDVQQIDLYLLLFLMIIINVLMDISPKIINVNNVTEGVLNVQQNMNAKNVSIHFTELKIIAVSVLMDTLI